MHMGSTMSFTGRQVARYLRKSLFSSLPFYDAMEPKLGHEIVEAITTSA